MKTPTLRRHVSGRAYTRFKGKCTYFGKFGTEEAQQRFQQWLADMDLVEDKFRHVSLLLLAAKFMDHAERNHQGLDNEIIEPNEQIGSIAGKIECRERLGGMLKYYHRPAA